MQLLRVSDPGPVRSTTLKPTHDYDVLGAGDVCEFTDLSGLRFISHVNIDYFRC